jgi:hypothetical protein
VCTAAENALAGTAQSSAGCPYVERWLGYYGGRGAGDIERAIRRYVPEAESATSASEYIGPIAAKVAGSVRRWATTGEITGVPAEAALEAGVAAAAGAVGEVASEAAGALASGVESVAGSIGGAIGTAASVLFKRRDGGIASAADPQAVRSRLNEGRPLDAGVRGRMERAFGQSFGAVRVHTDSTAGSLAESLSARAFTVGSDVAFAADEYRPGSIAGDALIAHELAHTVQQTGGSTQATGVLEADADEAALGALTADRATVGHRTGVQLQRCNSGTAPPTPAPTPAPPPAPEKVFEDPTAWAVAGAPKAFQAYSALSDSQRRKAFEISYPSGHVGKALGALGRTNAEDDKYFGSAQELLRWVEEAETQKAFGAGEKAMVTKQADFLKSDPKVVSGGGWGGTKKTRWASLLSPAQLDWKKRGYDAIKKMVTYAATAAPELKLADTTFELEFEEIDKIALGALATGGSKPGKTLYVGFEFVAAVEVNPAYALSTVVHELYGHPTYDTGGSSYAGELYKKAAAEATAKGAKLSDTEGGETYNYYQSEIYSLLKELPYWTKVSAAEAGKKLDVASKTKSTLEDLNFDPRGSIVSWLSEIKARWEPSVGAALLAGFYKRISVDPTIQKMSVTEFESLVKKVFGTKAADILK